MLKYDWLTRNKKCILVLSTEKSCPVYPPPKNGALACNSYGTDRICAAMCRNPSDFVFNPPLLYYCSAGEWRFFAHPAIPYQTTLPWPDCSGKVIISTVRKTRICRRNIYLISIKIILTKP